MAIRRTTTPPATIASEAGGFLGLVDRTPRLRRRDRDPGPGRGLRGSASERPTFEGQPLRIIARGFRTRAVPPWPGAPLDPRSAHPCRWTTTRSRTGAL